MISVTCLLFVGCVEAGCQNRSKDIQKLRMGTLVIKTNPGAKVKVQQLEHEFMFGTAISSRIFNKQFPDEDKEKYLSILKDNFNSGVHENALKWYSTEVAKNRISYENADIVLDWCDDNGIRMRGHCVFWCVEQKVQSWIKYLDDDILRNKLENRAVDVMSRYKGRISEYDVNNEMLHGQYFEDRLGNSIRHEMFKWCHETDSNAILYVNDYGILNGGDLDRYEAQIESLIKAGIPLGGIGLQGHFGARIDTIKVKHVLDRLARYKLPIKITEFDMNTSDEKLKARNLVAFYNTVFAHPSVEGILMWGFWEGLHWRPDAALWNKDWTPTMAARAYHDLVYDRWWTQYEGMADEKGICEVKVFFGFHQIEVNESVQKQVWVRKMDGTKIITIIPQ